MLKKSLFPVAIVLLFGSCNDDRLPTAPTAAAPAAVNASVFEAPPSSSGVSTICMVNRKALSDLDGQVQDNPDNEALKAEYEVQAAITADICD